MSAVCLQAVAPYSSSPSLSCLPPTTRAVRDVFDHAFNVLGERSLRIDWSRFIVTNCVSNVNYLMRIYRLTEQELNSHNPFFAQTPDEARHRLIKAELLRTYKLHVAVSNPRAYLRKLSTAVLSRILRSSDFKSESVRTLTREVLTTFVRCTQTHTDRHGHRRRHTGTALHSLSSCCVVLIPSFPPPQCAC